MERNYIRKKELIYVVLLIALSVMLRSITMPGSDINYSFDPGNYLLAMEDYSIEDHRPHAPGYFLFVKLLELTAVFTSDGYSAYFLLSNFFVAFSVPFMYLLLRRWQDEKASFFITMIFMTNPVIWFYANIPETYIFDVLFSLVLIYCGVSKRYIWLVMPILALGTGVRISSGVLLLPVAIFMIWMGWRNKKFRLLNILLSFILAVLFFLSWFLPVISTSGGLTEWYHTVSTHNPYPDSREALSFISIVKNSFYVAVYLIYLIFPLILSYLFLSLTKSSKREIFPSAELKKVLAFWILPAVLFFLLYYYVKGYILIVAGGLYLALSMINRKLTVLAFMIALILQLAYFFLFPYHDSGPEYYYHNLREGLPQTELFSKRLFGDLSMTKNQIDFLDMRYSAIERGLDKLINMGVLAKGKTVLIDPATGIFSRGLQPKYPEVRFAEIPPVFDNNYQYFIGKRSKTVDGFSEILGNTVIIATKKSDKEYFAGMKERLFGQGDLNFSLPKKGKIADIYQRYVKLCSIKETN